MKTLIAILITILSITFTFAQEKPVAAKNTKDWMLGIWTGVGYQIDGKTWDVKLTHTNQDYIIEYPSLKCKGTWTITEKSDYRIVFNETSKGSCDQNVKVIVTQVDTNFISVAYFLPQYLPNEVIAFVVLKKVDK